LPGYGGPVTSPFPAFNPSAYLNGGAVPELTNHPLLYDYFRSALYNGTDDRVFRAGDMEPLLRPNAFAQGPVDANASTLVTDLLRLCPTSLGSGANSPKYRNLVTTLSMDLGMPGVIPYWWGSTNAMGVYSPASPYPNPPVPANPLAAPVSASVPFPTMPPSGAVTNNPGATPPNPSEFGADWKAVSAALGRIKLNRPLPPYPHMGSGLMPPYQAALVTWGTAYDLTKGPIAAQYNAALGARQTLANDIYRRLLALTGVTPVANPATPTSTELIPRRWLAQLAANIVDFIDEDDFSTPFNFYTTSDGLTVAQIGTTQGGDDPGTNAQNQSGTNSTGANPTYWVFGTELPKVLLNEVLAEAKTPAATAAGADTINVWVELFNTMQIPPTLPNAVQQQDGYRVPLYMTIPGGTTGYSPYRVSIAQTLMTRPPPGSTVPAPPAPNSLPDASANVLGKAWITSPPPPPPPSPFPQSTTDADLAAANVQLMNGTKPQPAPANGPNVTGIDPSSYFLIGPKQPVTGYLDPFQASTATTPGVPPTTPFAPTNNVSYQQTWVANSTSDERTTGLTVMLRRLANPYLPFNPLPVNAMGNLDPTYNPYVTVDYIQNIQLQPAAGPCTSRGKRQPYAAYFMPAAPATPTVPNAASPVVDQTGTQIAPPTVTTTFGNANAPLPSTGSYDWLAHLDRQLVSPMELLHVSGYQPYMLTQQFIVPQAGSTGDNNAPTNMFRHYVPWLDMMPGVAPAAPWWFDSTLVAGQTHRLYRLFEFLECGDRAVGVDGLGRIPGRVNINTIWDTEILRALADANPSMGNINDTFIDQVFANLLASRTPGGTPGQTDRPFLPLSTGLITGGAAQFPNGVSVATDTLLRLSPNAAPPQLLLFQNPNDATPTGATPPLPQYWHPYYQTQLLTKLYNNVTTRSNTFAVFLTVGFFQVTDATTTPPTLGAEIGRAEGRQVRHRMFAIVDRSNLSAFSTTYAGAAIAVTPATGPQTVAVTFNPPGGVNPNTGLTWAIGGGSVLVFEPGTDNEETVVVQQPPGMPPPPMQATFYKSHAAGVPVIQRGNPGPWIIRYDPRRDPLVVPYYSLID
jgi:hypothetical protein